jgi:hypothetical protein
MFVRAGVEGTTTGISNSSEAMAPAVGRMSLI